MDDQATPPIKTVEEWEKETGCILPNGVDITRTVSWDDFLKLRDDSGFVGVNHEDRTKFLEDNGYEVTRENMVDSSLSSKTPEVEA